MPVIPVTIDTDADIDKVINMLYMHNMVPGQVLIHMTLHQIRIDNYYIL